MALTSGKGRRKRLTQNHGEREHAQRPAQVTDKPGPRCRTERRAQIGVYHLLHDEAHAGARRQQRRSYKA